MLNFHRLFLLIGWLVLIFSSVGNAQQILIDDDFSDGNLTENPAWTDPNNRHIVNAANELQLNAPAESDTAIILTESSAAFGEWEFLIRYDFNPSSTSFSRIYLVADTSTLKGAVDGYYVRVGHTDDEVSLFRQDATEDVKIIDGTDDLIDAGSVTVRIRVRRATDGSWELFADPSGGQNYISQGTIQDNTYTISRYFGIFSKYIGSRSTLYFYDDVTVTKQSPPLVVESVEPVNNSTLNVLFNIPLNVNSVEAADFVVSNGVGTPQQVAVTNQRMVMLQFDEPIPGGSYELTINSQDIEDSSGNNLSEDASIPFTLFDFFEPGDIVINEFMYDPPPGTGLPEYIELRNTGSKILNLQNWQLEDENIGDDIITTDSLVMEPNSFLVISSDTAALSAVFSSRNYQQMPNLSALNNGGDQIQLIMPDGVRADSLAYTPAWGGEDVALERRDAEAPSTAIENWGDSPAALGGTPGRPNLIEGDDEPPSLTGLRFPDSQTLILAFSESLNTETSEDPGNYTFSGDPEIQNIEIPSPDTVLLRLAPPMVDNTNYRLSVTNIEDLFGNLITPIDTAFTFFEISEAEPGDVAITEFMYDPPDGFTEFVELQNISNKTIDLKDWTFNDATGSPEQITVGSVVLPPDEFIILAPDNTLNEQFPDINLLALGSGFSSLNNSGDQIKLFNPDGVLMDSLLYDDAWGGQEVSLERRSTQVSAVFQANWGDSPSPAGATPGAPNEIEPDNQPPGIISFEVVDARNIQILFSEQVFNASAPSQYTIDPPVDIQNVSVSKDTVDITLAADLISGTTFSLSINGITDLFGNQPDEPLRQNFTFFETAPPTQEALFITEFMYDPPAGYSEYVELRNTSDTALDLTGVMINDNSSSPGIISSKQAVLPASQRIVLVPDSTLVPIFPDASFLVIGSAFQNLNNGGDAITIFDRNGNTLDSLLYTTDWGGEEVALERRTTGVSAIFRENWDNSPSPDFGTPGSVNLVAPDETPPQLLSVEALTDARVRITLSERPDENSATDPNTYQISPDRSLQMVIVDGSTVELILSQPLVTDQEFTLRVQNLRDLFGNTLDSSSQTFELFRFQQPRPGDVVINEILFQKAVNSDVEFVELFNRSDRDIDLNLWQIGDSGGNPNFIDAPGSFSIIPIPSNEFVVLTNDEDFANSSDNFIAVRGFPSLNDDEDAVFIRDGEGRTIDSLFYSSTWGGDENGFSLERIDPFGASNDRSNWRTSQTDSGTTPGSENSVLQIDEIPPKPNFATLQQNDQIRITFDEFIQRTDDLTIQVDGSPVDIVAFNRTEADRLLVEGAPVDVAANPQIEIRNLSDFRGNITDAASIPLSLPAEPGEVVFNEIMYDPIIPDRNDQPSQSEYVELINRSSHAISLEGITIFEERLADGSFDGRLDIVETQRKFIPAGGQFLVYADPAERFEDSRINRFFGFDSIPFFARVDATSLQLTNSGQPILLADSTGATIDSVVYDPEWHNPNLIDTKGISLERKVPEASSNDARNWGSASTNAIPEGGTPGFENTLFAPSEDLEQENSITLQPNPFSPNDDGKDDNLIIDYNLSESDFLLKIRIFDRYGREIRTLADGEPAGRSGSIIWDGLDESGRKNRIGYYIVYFEAFNSANGTNQVFKKTVVLARQL